MVESEHLTMEEGEVELKDLESREIKNNETRKQQLPEEKKKRHATIVPSMFNENTQRPNQETHGGETTAPNHNNIKKYSHSFEKEPLPNNKGKETYTNAKYHVIRNNDQKKQKVNENGQIEQERTTKMGRSRMT